MQREKRNEEAAQEACCRSTKWAYGQYWILK